MSTTPDTPPARNFAGYFLWWSDFFTEFQQGAIRGCLPGTGAGVGAGGVSWKVAEQLDVQEMALVGAGAAVSTIVANGLANAVVWARTNPVPNPFRPATK